MGTVREALQITVVSKRKVWWVGGKVGRRKKLTKEEGTGRKIALVENFEGDKESSEGVIRRIAKPNGGEGRDANENLFSKQVKTLYRLASYFPHCFPESCELLWPFLARKPLCQTRFRLQFANKSKIENKNANVLKKHTPLQPPIDRDQFRHDACQTNAFKPILPEMPVLVSSTATERGQRWNSSIGSYLLRELVSGVENRTLQIF